jgi:hypothetical protein
MGLDGRVQDLFFGPTDNLIRFSSEIGTKASVQVYFIFFFSMSG